MNHFDMLARRAPAKLCGTAPRIYDCNFRHAVEAPSCTLRLLPSALSRWSPSPNKRAQARSRHQLPATPSGSWLTGSRRHGFAFFGYAMPVCACRHVHHDGTVITRTPLDPLRVGDGARGCA